MHHISRLWARYTAQTSLAALTITLPIAMLSAQPAAPEADTAMMKPNPQQQAEIDQWPADKRATYDGWPSGTQSYYWTLSPQRQKMFWGLTDADRVTLSGLPPADREEAWGRIEARYKSSERTS